MSTKQVTQKKSPDYGNGPFATVPSALISPSVLSICWSRLTLLQCKSNHRYTGVSARPNSRIPGKYADYDPGSFHQSTFPA